MTRKVLIDCGTHFGQGLEEFITKFNVDSTWTVHSFEANPFTYSKLESGDVPSRYAGRKRLDYVQYHNAAVSTKNDYLNLNIETHPDEDYNDTGQGTSTVALDKWMPHNGGTKHLYTKQCTVPCFDFSGFIANNFTRDDHIVIKMDIEGAEYDVLEDMIARNVIQWIHHIAIEFHAQYFTNKDEMLLREEKILETFAEKGISYERWY